MQESERDSIIVDRFLSGETLSSIGKRFGISRQRVFQKCNKSRVCVRTGCNTLAMSGTSLCWPCYLSTPFSEIENIKKPLYASVIEAKKQGLTNRKVAELFGISEGRVWQICKKGIA
jgi:DNA-directed RNA polymerase specialized sigma subunit